ncbi:MAG TPA: polyphosphate kinase 2 family protein [Planktothrix sp.]|jgi:PPK2 family polyphosphate:nucleotide phosphotransferase
MKNLDRLADEFVVEPGEKVSLKKEYRTRIKPDVEKDELKALLQDGILQLASQQDKLYAEANYALLIVLQAMDAAGKDSTIKHVMSGVNPQGCRVYSFKAPSAEELNHDYLWRCSRLLPERGCIGIFNRSYYEEVLVSRVHPEILAKQRLPDHLNDKNIWKRRFSEINNFERYLVDNGIIVLKFFLYVSKEEQKKRFLARIDQPEKNWKFSADDARDRNCWDDYIKAYEDCFSHTSTDWAPWHVIPADYKPFTRLAVAHIIQKKLKQLKLDYPQISDKQHQELLAAKKILDAES